MAKYNSKANLKNRNDLVKGLIEHLKDSDPDYISRMVKLAEFLKEGFCANACIITMLKARKKTIPEEIILMNGDLPRNKKEDPKVMRDIAEAAEFSIGLSIRREQGGITPGKATIKGCGEIQFLAALIKGNGAKIGTVILILEKTATMRQEDLLGEIVAHITPIFKRSLGLD